MAEAKIIVALDYPDAQAALALAARLDPAACKVKVGKELFTASGPALVRELVGRGFQVFLDLKFHDIPNTVAAACRAAARLGVWMVNVHALGGEAMLKAARVAIDAAPVDVDGRRPLLSAVTMLTSMSDQDLAALGLSGTVTDNVLRLAQLSQRCGLDGVVCSGQEASLLRRTCGPAFVLVTPGIRPAGGASHDQARVLTPSEALRQGADYLVIGRPITQAPDPLQAVNEINDSIARYLNEEPQQP